MEQNRLKLPTPSLVKNESLGVSFYTDEALFNEARVRIGFTCSFGGVSGKPYEGLNLGSHVGDCPEAVACNRQIALQAMGASGSARLAVLDQVHGGDVALISSGSDARLGSSLLPDPIAAADAVVVSGDVQDVAAMLMYADCMPVILVAPDGTFAVVHAGWRGVASLVVANALDALLESVRQRGLKVPASDVNAYIGPCIRRECFEVGDDVRETFASEFGDAVLCGERNVDLVAAVTLTLLEAGVDSSRIADIGKCTVCSDGEFFSYRASGGVCGRHAAIGFSTR